MDVIKCHRGEQLGPSWFGGGGEAVTGPRTWGPEDSRLLRRRTDGSTEGVCRPADRCPVRPASPTSPTRQLRTLACPHAPPCCPPGSGSAAGSREGLPTASCSPLRTDTRSPAPPTAGRRAVGTPGARGEARLSRVTPPLPFVHRGSPRAWDGVGGRPGARRAP